AKPRRRLPGISIRGAVLQRQRVPRTSARNLELPERRAFWIALRRAGVVSGVVPVGAPLPDAAAHIERPVGRGAQRKAAHGGPGGGSGGAADGATPLEPLVSPGIEPPIRSARRLFPLRLRGKPLAGVGSVGLGLEEGDAADRLIRPGQVRPFFLSEKARAHPS